MGREVRDSANEGRGNERRCPPCGQWGGGGCVRVPPSRGWPGTTLVKKHRGGARDKHRKRGTIAGGSKKKHKPPFLKRKSTGTLPQIWASLYCRQLLFAEGTPEWFCILLCSSALGLKSPLCPACSNFSAAVWRGWRLEGAFLTTPPPPCVGASSDPLTTRSCDGRPRTSCGRSANRPNRSGISTSPRTPRWKVASTSGRKAATCPSSTGKSSRGGRSVCSVRLSSPATLIARAVLPPAWTPPTSSSGYRGWKTERPTKKTDRITCTQELKRAEWRALGKRAQRGTSQVRRNSPPLPHQPRLPNPYLKTVCLATACDRELFWRLLLRGLEGETFLCNVVAIPLPEKCLHSNFQSRRGGWTRGLRLQPHYLSQLMGQISFSLTFLKTFHPKKIFT